MTKAKRFLSRLKKFDRKTSKVYGWHIPIPYEIADAFIEGTKRRIKCTFENGYEHFTGLMPFKHYWYILVSTDIVSTLNLSEEQEITILLEKDNSQYGMSMPEELQVLLDQDETGFKHFDNLTPGKQRNLIYIVSKVKNTNKRLSKALAIVNHLNSQNGQLDFKLLAQKIKEYNHQGNLN